WHKRFMTTDQVKKSHGAALDKRPETGMGKRRKMPFLAALLATRSAPLDVAQHQRQRISDKTKISAATSIMAMAVPYKAIVWLRFDLPRPCVRRDTGGSSALMRTPMPDWLLDAAAAGATPGKEPEPLPPSSSALATTSFLPPALATSEPVLRSSGSLPK